MHPSLSSQVGSFFSGRKEEREHQMQPTLECFQIGIPKQIDPDGDRWPPTYSTGSKQLSIVAVS